MPTISPAALRAAIASQSTAPVYAIVGDDEREKSALALELGEMVEAELRAFNVDRMYATDAAVTSVAVAEIARTLPMMAPRRVVVVLQAEKLLVPKRRKGAELGEGDEEPASPLDPLADYLADPSPTTTLAFVFSEGEGTKDAGDVPMAKNLKITKALLGVATVVACTGLDSVGDAGRFVDEQVRAAGLTIDRPAIARLVQMSGADKARLRDEVEKLILFGAGLGRITAEDVSAVVGSVSYHGDQWALVRAIEQGNTALALRELSMALENGGVPFQILGQIGYAVRTPPPRGRYPSRRVPAAVEALLRTDLALKSSGGDPGALLERLVLDLCEERRT